MTKRKVDATIGKPVKNPFKGSLIGTEGSKTKVKIPTCANKAIRYRCETILTLNPYIEQAQMNMVHRLASLQWRFENLDKQVEQEGITSPVLDRTGEEVGSKPNPCLTVMATISGQMINLERNLGITVPSRAANVPKEQQDTPRAPGSMTNATRTENQPGGVGRVTGKPVLKLA